MPLSHSMSFIYLWATQTLIRGLLLAIKIKLIAQVLTCFIFNLFLPIFQFIQRCNSAENKKVMQNFFHSHFFRWEIFVAVKMWVRDDVLVTKYSLLLNSFQLKIKVCSKVFCHSCWLNVINLKIKLKINNFIMFYLAFHLFRSMMRDDYFRVTFDHELCLLTAFEAAVKISSSLKSNHHMQI